MNLFAHISSKFTYNKKEVSDVINPPSAQSDVVHQSSVPGHEIHDLTGDSPDSSPLKPVTPKFRTKAVPSLLDEDEKEHVNSQRSQRPHRRDPKSNSSSTSETPFTGHLFGSTDFSHVRASRQREVSSPEERRVLGDPQPAPKDAVRISIPGSSQTPDASPMNPMPDHNRTKRFISGPYKVVDTLNQTAPRSNQTLMLHKVSKGSGPQDHLRISTKHKTSPTNSKSSRANDHNIPNKRQRTGEAPIRSTATPSIISIESGDDETSPPKQRQKPVPVSSVVDATSVDDLEMLDTPSSHKSTAVEGHEMPLQELTLFETSERDQRLQDHHSDQARNSSTSLNTRYHVRTAQKRRELDSLISSSPATSKTKAIVQNKSQNPQTPLADVRHMPIEDSPDELQAVGVTIPLKVQDRISHKIKDSHASSTRSDILFSGAETQLVTLQSLENEKLYRYSLKSILFYDGVSVSEFELVLVPRLRRFLIFLKDSILEQEPILSLSLNKIRKIDYADSTNDTKITILTSTHSMQRNKFDLDFESGRDRRDFLVKVQEVINVKVVVRTTDHMAKVFEKNKIAAGGDSTDIRNSDPNRPKLSHMSNSKKVPVSVPGQDRPARKDRLVDLLDSPDSIAAITSEPRGSVGTQREPRPNTDGNLLRRTSANTGTYSPYFDKSTRSTRSTTMQKSTESEPEPKLATSVPKISELIKVRSSKPLVLQGPAKKRESLSHSDFERLDEDEFLNDNLISFFLLYLQKQADPTQLKRMHFHNTFFYSALTKDAKGRTNINYDAVARWTKNVNLFSRDFVIVPVNENFHWFVMIICNLPTLKMEVTGNRTQSSDGIRTDTVRLEDKDQMGVSSDVLSPESARESFQELSLDDGVESKHQTHDSSGARKSRKNNMRSRGIKKYDVRKPVIITLDSLDQMRSVTATQLKKYIASLASDPNQHGTPFDVDANSIPGMTAKGIPHQNNFSDCGLYLCMYMEQFISDPDSFVRKVLQRERTGPRWPANITSRELRERLAKLLNQLYEQQVYGGIDESLPELGSILVDMLPAEDEVVEILSPPDNLDLTHDQVLHARKFWEHGKSKTRQPEQGSQTETNQIDHDGNDSSGTEKLSGDAAQHEQILDRKTSPPEESPHENSTSIANRPPTASLHKEDTDLVVEVAAPSTADLLAPDHDTPAALAGRIAPQRSPQKQSQIGEHNSESEAHRHARSDSVSTDFLVGSKSYKDVDHGFKHRRSKSSSVQLSPRALRSRAKSPSLPKDGSTEAHARSTTEGAKEFSESPGKSRSLQSRSRQNMHTDAHKSVKPSKRRADDQTEEMLV